MMWYTFLRFFGCPEQNGEWDAAGSCSSYGHRVWRPCAWKEKEAKPRLCGLWACQRQFWNRGRRPQECQVRTSHVWLRNCVCVCVCDRLMGSLCLLGSHWPLLPGRVGTGGGGWVGQCQESEWPHASLPSHFQTMSCAIKTEPTCSLANVQSKPNTVMNSPTWKAHVFLSLLHTHTPQTNRSLLEFLGCKGFKISSTIKSPLKGA